jgi:lia operon protein LiaG
MSARLIRTTILSSFISTTLVAQGTPAASTEQRSIKGAQVAIYNLVGRLKAVPGTGEAVVVEITRGGADASKLKIESGSLRGRETLRIVYPADRIVYPEMRYRSRTSVNVRPDGTFSDGGDWNEWRDRDRVDIRGSGDGLEAYADLTVRIPKGQKIELFLAVGRLEVQNVEGDLMIDVAAADVDVSGTRGPLSLDTGSGRVSVKDVTGNITLDSGSGGLVVDRVKGGTLHIDSGSGGVEGNDIEVGELNADVGSGGLRLYKVKSPVVSAETGSGGITIEILSDIQRLTVETGSGGATVRVPATLSAEIDAETGSGGFSTDFEVTTRRVGRNHISGRIGDGKGRISIEAGSGSVRLLKN